MELNLCINVPSLSPTSFGIPLMAINWPSLWPSQTVLKFGIGVFSCLT